MPNNVVEAKYGGVPLARAYADLDDRSIRELLRETWHKKQVFEPYTHFKEAPIKGRFVNVHEAGFRISKNQGRWPPASTSYFVNPKPLILLSAPRRQERKEGCLHVTFFAWRHLPFDSLRVVSKVERRLLREILRRGRGSTALCLFGEHGLG